MVKIQIRSKNIWEDETEFLLIVIDSKNEEIANKVKLVINIRKIVQPLLSRKIIQMIFYICQMKEI